MRFSDVQITGLTHGYRDLSITIDGTDISPQALAGLSIKAGTDGVPRLTLDVVAVDVTKVGGQMEILIPDETRGLLVELGWTPPADE